MNFKITTAGSRKLKRNEHESDIPSQKRALVVVLVIVSAVKFVFRVF